MKGCRVHVCVCGVCVRVQCACAVCVSVRLTRLERAELLLHLVELRVVSLVRGAHRLEQGLFGLAPLALQRLRDGGLVCEGAPGGVSERERSAAACLLCV